MNENVESRGANHSGQWSLGDLIDFEVLFAQADKGTNPGLLPRHEEGLYAEFQSQAASESKIKGDRSGLFRFWLERRRPGYFGHEPSPGEQVESALRWLTFALAVGGFLLARGAVYSFFRAPESMGQRAEPINVFWYSLVCIGLPLLFTVCGFWWLLGVRAVPRLPRAPAFVRGALLGLLRPVLLRVGRKVSDVSGPEKRLAGQALWGAFRRRAMDRGGAVGLRLTTTAQAFGLGFTAGILLFSWLECMFYSRVFGWQTTQFTITTETAYRLVQVTAVPWAWIAGEGRGFPNLVQMAATRFVRYQDPGVFPAEAAAAWANYLIAAALVYGFLPRALLYLLSKRELRQALQNPNFNQARFDRLWERLTKPNVQIQGPPPGAEQVLPPVARAMPQTPGAEVQCVLILPEELNAPGRQEAIIQWLASEKRWVPAEIIPLMAETARIETAVKEIARAHAEHTITRAVFIQESFMPPVKGVLKLLAQIKKVMGTSGVAVGLLGKPSDHPLGEPPSETDFEVWEAKVLSLADSGIDVFSFRPPAL